MRPIHVWRSRTPHFPCDTTTILDYKQLLNALNKCKLNKCELNTKKQNQLYDKIEDDNFKSLCTNS
jgi:hypothetical protein